MSIVQRIYVRFFSHHTIHLEYVGHLSLIYPESDVQKIQLWPREMTKKPGKQRVELSFNDRLAIVNNVERLHEAALALKYKVSERTIAEF